MTNFNKIRKVYKFSAEYVESFNIFDMKNSNIKVVDKWKGKYQLWNPVIKEYFTIMKYPQLKKLQDNNTPGFSFSHDCLKYYKDKNTNLIKSRNKEFFFIPDQKCGKNSYFGLDLFKDVYQTYFNHSHEFINLEKKFFQKNQKLVFDIDKKFNGVKVDKKLFLDYFCDKILKVGFKRYLKKDITFDHQCIQNSPNSKKLSLHITINGFYFKSSLFKSIYLLLNYLHKQYDSSELFDFNLCYKNSTLRLHGCKKLNINESTSKLVFDECNTREWCFEDTLACYYNEKGLKDFLDSTFITRSDFTEEARIILTSLHTNKKINNLSIEEKDLNKYVKKWIIDKDLENKVSFKSGYIHIQLNDIKCPTCNRIHDSENGFIKKKTNGEYRFYCWRDMKNSILIYKEKDNQVVEENKEKVLDKEEYLKWVKYVDKDVKIPYNCKLQIIDRKFLIPKNCKKIPQDLLFDDRDVLIIKSKTGSGKSFHNRMRDEPTFRSLFLNPRISIAKENLQKMKGYELYSDIYCNEELSICLKLCMQIESLVRFKIYINEMLHYNNIYFDELISIISQLTSDTMKGNGPIVYRILKILCLNCVKNGGKIIASDAYTNRLGLDFFTDIGLSYKLVINQYKENNGICKRFKTLNELQSEFLDQVKNGKMCTLPSATKSFIQETYIHLCKMIDKGDLGITRSQILIAHSDADNKRIEEFLKGPDIFIKKYNIKAILYTSIFFFCIKIKTSFYYCFSYFSAGGINPPDMNQMINRVRHWKNKNHLYIYIKNKPSRMISKNINQYSIRYNLNKKKNLINDEFGLNAIYGDEGYCNILVTLEQQKRIYNMFQEDVVKYTLEEDGYKITDYSRNKIHSVEKEVQKIPSYDSIQEITENEYDILKKDKYLNNDEKLKIKKYIFQKKTNKYYTEDEYKEQYDIMINEWKIFNNKYKKHWINNIYSLKRLKIYNKDDNKYIKDKILTDGKYIKKANHKYSSEVKAYYMQKVLKILNMKNLNEIKKLDGDELKRIGDIKSKKGDFSQIEFIARNIFKYSGKPKNKNILIKNCIKHIFENFAGHKILTKRKSKWISGKTTHENIYHLIPKIDFCDNDLKQKINML